MIKRANQNGVIIMMRWIVCLTFSLVCAAVQAATGTTFSFDGCVDASGQPVSTQADLVLPWIAKAGTDSGVPVIRYNPEILPELPTEARLFIFAHECARIYLGQSLSGERRAEEVRAADCQAMAMLENSKVVQGGAAIQSVETALMAHPEVWLPARELRLAACTRAEKKPRGGLGLPQAKGVHPDQWNLCASACGNTLFKCGRSSACLSRYDVCVEKCGEK